MANSKILTDSKGMTLYTYDKDTNGVSDCYDQCAVAWPPYYIDMDAHSGAEWTQVARTNDKAQWAYQGKPLYYFVDDKKAGDVTGNEPTGTWHVIDVA